MIVAEGSRPGGGAVLIVTLTYAELNDLRAGRVVQYPMEPKAAAVLVYAAHSDQDALAMLEEHAAHVTGQERLA